MVGISLQGFVVLVGVLVLCGVVQGTIGFGLGLVFLPFLSVIAPQHAPQIVLLLGLPAILVVLWRERSAVNLNVVGWLVSGRLVGTLGGVWLIVTLSLKGMQLGFGIAILATVAVMVARPVVIKSSASLQLGAGLVSGVMGTATGLGGPPMALLFSGNDGPSLRSTLSAVLLVGNVVSLTGLAAVGRLALADFVLAVGLLLPLAVGLRLSSWTIQHVATDRLHLAVMVVSAIGALVVIAQAF